MSGDDAVSKVMDLCAQARAALGTNGSRTLEILLDMVMVELRRLAARRRASNDNADQAGTPPQD